MNSMQQAQARNRSKRKPSVGSNLAVIYARVSSKDQEDGFSIDAQLDLLRKYAREKSLSVAHEFVDVETAKSAGRAKFGEMLQFIERHHLPVNILVEKTDRAYRNLKDYTKLDDLVREKDTRIHLVKENEMLGREASSHAKFFHGIKVLMAKNYVDNLSEEVRKGQMRKAEEGQYPSIPPLGYRWDREKRSLVHAGNEAEGVRRIFELYATSRYSLSVVARTAAEEGYRTRQGGPINKRTVEQLVKNPIYYGDFYWSGKLYQGKFEPIVTRELWEAAQIALRRANRPETYHKQEFDYRGLFTCDRCGWAVTAERKKGRYVYYHCGNHSRVCERSYVRQEALEAVLREKITALHVPDDMALLLQKVLDEVDASCREQAERNLGPLQKKTDELKARLDRLYTDHVSGKIDEEFFLNKWNAWKAELSQAENDLARIANPSVDARKHMQNVIELCNRVKSLYDQGNGTFRAQLAEIVSSNLSLDGPSVRFDYRFPFDLMVKRDERHFWRALADAYRTVAAEFAWKPTQQGLLVEELLAA